MIRDIILHGPLAKAAGTDKYRLNVDNPQQLWAALRAQSTALNMALRQPGQVGLVASDEDDSNIRSLEPGFQFGDANKRLHIVTPTDGAWWYLAEIVVMLVVSYAVTRLTMSSMQTNSNGPGGPKSTMFNGPVNSTDQGGAIPQGFGKKFLFGTEVVASDESYTNLL